MQAAIIDNRYAVRGLLGSGGTARVYRAYDRMLDRDVALKVLGEHLAGDEDLIERFRQEAQSVAVLSHENIVAVYDRGSSAEGYYIAMEYVSGGTLKGRITRDGALSYGTSVEVGRQVAEALRVAHDHGIVHRDVKPHNILLTGTGTVKVADFGIAQPSPSEEASQESLVFGTVRYMSPEQAMGEAVGPRSDLYSLGVVLYESLTGEVPFDAESPVAVAMKHVGEHPRPLREVNPEVPRAMSAVVARLLEKDPADRYPDADGLLEALERLQAGAAPDSLERFPLSGGALHGPGPAAAAGGWRRRARRASAVVLVAAVAFAGTAGWNPPQSGPAPAAAAVEGLETGIPAPQLPEPGESASAEADTSQAGADEPAAEEPDEPAASGAGEQEDPEPGAGSPGTEAPGGSENLEEPPAAETPTPAAQGSREPAPDPASEPEAAEPAPDPVAEPAPDPVAEPVEEAAPEPVPDGGSPAGTAPGDPAPAEGAPAQGAPEAEEPGPVVDGGSQEPAPQPVEEAPEAVEPLPESEAVEPVPQPDAEPEAPEVEAGEPEAPGQEAPEPESEVPEPEVPEPEAVEPEVPEVEIPEPEVPEVEVPEPETVESEAPELEAVESEAVAPEVPEPEVPEVEVPEQEAVEPMPQPEVPEPEIPEPEVPGPGTGAGPPEDAPGALGDSGPGGDSFSPGPEEVPGPPETEAGPGGAPAEDVPGPASQGAAGGS